MIENNLDQETGETSMSGVIDKSGVQWEHCCHCGEFVKIQDLEYGFSPKWPNYKNVDLCPKCYKELHSEK